MFRYDYKESQEGLSDTGLMVPLCERVGGGKCSSLWSQGTLHL